MKQESARVVESIVTGDALCVKDWEENSRVHGCGLAILKDGGMSRMLAEAHEPQHEDLWWLLEGMAGLLMHMPMSYEALQVGELRFLHKVKVDHALRVISLMHFMLPLEVKSSGFPVSLYNLGP